MLDIGKFIKNMPKTELHVHIEGTVTPERTLEFAKRNNLDFQYSSVEEILAAQDYGDPHFENFLNHHYACLDVIKTGQDMYDITVDFLKNCGKENFRYVELMFDPQLHMARGLSFKDIIVNLRKGMTVGEVDYGVMSKLQMCATRENPIEMTMDLLEQAKPYKLLIDGVGIDSLEDGNPPRKFIEFFMKAKEQGYRLAAHCDVWREESINNIGECLHLIQVERIDHGVDVLDNRELMKSALDKNICFTMCPTSRPADPKPRRLEELRKMFDRGLLVTVNTDDPTRFSSGFLNNTLIEVQKHTPYTALEMVQLMRNAFNGSWLDEENKKKFIKELNDYAIDCGAMDNV